MYRFPYTLVCLVLVILIVCVRTLVNSKLCAELLLRCTWWSVNDHFQFAHKWIFVHLHIEILVFCTSFVWSWSFSTIALLYQLDIFCVQDMGNIHVIFNRFYRVLFRCETQYFYCHCCHCCAVEWLFCHHFAETLLKECRARKFTHIQHKPMT